jgi:hypothetical protein
MAHHEIENGVRIAIGPCWIAPEHVIDASTIVLAARHLAVAVVVCFASGLGKSLDFVAFGMLDKTEVRVRVSSWLVEVDAQRAQSSAEPILKMKLFVFCAFPSD